MKTAAKKIEARVFAVLRRAPPEGWVYRTAFWLVIAYLVICGVGLVPGAANLLQPVRWVICGALLLLCLILLLRWTFAWLLWSVRNRLIITYVLMGLAPVVLFVTLALIAAFIFSGQFAAFAATSVLQGELLSLRAEGRDVALRVAQSLQVKPKSLSVPISSIRQSEASGRLGPLEFDVFQDGNELPLAGAQDEQPTVKELPQWIQPGFAQVVEDGGRLYLRAVETERANGHDVAVVAGLLLDNRSMEIFSQGLGNLRIDPAGTIEKLGDAKARSALAGAGVDATRGDKNQEGGESRAGSVKPVWGGVLPHRQHVFDIPVIFGAPLEVANWQTGKPESMILFVTSRPSLLYDRLFATSVHIGTVVRQILIATALFFCVLELIAFVMAVRLSRTITRSVNDLYRATTEVDKGNLAHRIEVRRNDQLAALGASFNGMTASLDRLLEERREKQRLESELAIAQEVQASLFPQGELSLPSLEIHGFCRPARLVSGDYYDLLAPNQREILLALGDISGKGISAALLMATLHSAVRAYELTERGLTVGFQDANRLRPELSPGQVSPLLAAPGRLLEMLNRHLYRATPPEKYATLFLAHYDAGNGQMIYANAGHLPPLVFRADGSLLRLDCGGMALGLLNDASYNEDQVSLEEGDLLVVYSDGITEPENTMGEFGETRLLDVVRSNRDRSLPEIAEKIMRAVTAWIGDAEQPDDITLVMARRRASSNLPIA